MWLSVREFNPFTFNVIISVVGFTSANFLLVFYMSFVFLSSSITAFINRYFNSPPVSFTIYMEIFQGFFLF